MKNTAALQTECLDVSPVCNIMYTVMHINCNAVIDTTLHGGIPERSFSLHILSGLSITPAVAKQMKF